MYGMTNVSKNPDLSGYAAANHTHTAAEVGARPDTWMPTAAQVGAAAANHTHTAADVGAAAVSHTHTAADVGAAAVSHTHTAADVGAAAANHTHNASDIVGGINANHTHGAADITSGVLPVERGGTGNGTGYVTAGRRQNRPIGSKATSEGESTEASGDSSHAEGENTKAVGIKSHAEGSLCEARGPASHAEGISTIAGGNGSHSEGLNLKVLFDENDEPYIPVNAEGLWSHTEGCNCFSKGEGCHAEGYETTAGVAEEKDAVTNEITVAGKSFCHSEGSYTEAVGEVSHSEGCRTKAKGENSHAEGYGTKAIGNYSHSEGYSTTAEGEWSHSEGAYSEAQGYGSHAGGVRTTAYYPYQTAIGLANEVKAGYFIIGCGSVNTNETVVLRANCFRVSSTDVYGGTYNSSGADYAEMFEWQDGNPDREDRAGRFVSLNGDKIRLASPTDSAILGIVSGSPSVCGDVHDDQWQGMFLRDVFGRPVWETVEVPAETLTETDPETGEQTERVIVPARTETRQKLNPNYDPSMPYTPRSQRPEWDAVGLLGKLVATDDGSCQVNGYATAGEDGIATASQFPTRFRVMKRLDETHVRVLVLNTAM